MTDVGVVLVTAPNEAMASKIGRALVEEGLVACANLVPRIRSIYRWQDKTFDEEEVLIVMKTRRSEFERVRARVKMLHPYEVPEVLLLDVAEGHVPYLEWVLEAVRPGAATASTGKPASTKRKARARR